jgi:hypothetical protein
MMSNERIQLPADLLARPFAARWGTDTEKAQRRDYGLRRLQGVITDLTVTLSERFSRIFACWHREMSWPFTADGETYRVCLHCGARRQFSPERWSSVGAYYHGAGYKERRPNSHRQRSWRS